MQIKCKRATKKEFREWFVFLGALLIGGVFLVVLHLCGVQLCLLKKHTGYSCLFCGSTRAAFLIVQLRLMQAFAVQPLATLAMIGAAVSLCLNSTLLVLRGVRLSISLSRGEKYLGLILLLLLALMNWSYLNLR